MSKARKALILIIPALLLISFAAYAFFSPRAGLPTVIGAAVYLILFALAAIACIKGFLNFFTAPDELPPSASLGERSIKRLHPIGKIILYSFIAQLVFIIAVYALNNLINGFRGTIFDWYGNAFVSGIAGSATDALNASEKFAVIPFLPYFISFISELIGIDQTLPAFILNTFAVMALCVVLYELMLLDFDKKTSSFAVVLLLISPAAVYMMMPLSGNALFLLLVLLVFLEYRKGRPFISGLLAMLAAMVNIFGFLLFIPLIIGGIRNCILAKQIKSEDEKDKKDKKINAVSKMLLSFIPLLALLAFVLTLHFSSAGATQPFKQLYPQGFRFFFEAFNEPAAGIANREFTFSVLYQILPLLFLGILFCVCLNEIRSSYAVCCLLLLAFAPTVFGTDMFPYTSALFPVLPVLLSAKLKTKKTRIIGGFIVFALQILFISTVFLAGRI